MDNKNYKYKMPYGMRKEIESFLTKVAQSNGQWEFKRKRRGDETVLSALPCPFENFVDDYWNFTMPDADSTKPAIISCSHFRIFENGSAVESYTFTDGFRFLLTHLNKNKVDED